MRKNNGLNFGKKRKKFNVRLFKEVVTWAAEILIVVGIAYVCVRYFGLRTSVVGNAMEDSLAAGDQILVNRFIYVLSHPKQGDVVVFLPNGNEKSHYYVRRVIGTPGDKIQIKDGSVYVNGEVYDEIDTATMEDPGVAKDEIKLGDEEYFVLGDNRNSSEDSRYANIGNVKEKYIEGKAWLRFSSFSNVSMIH